MSEVFEILEELAEFLGQSWQRPLQICRTNCFEASGVFAVRGRFERSYKAPANFYLLQEIEFSKEEMFRKNVFS